MFNFWEKNTTPVEAVDVDLNHGQINQIALRTMVADLQQENEQMRKELKDFESTFKYSRSLKKKVLQLQNENYRTKEMTLTDDVHFFRHQSIVRDKHNKEYKGEIDTLHKQVEKLKMITEQQQTSLQDLEVAQLNSHRLNVENKSLKKKNIDLQMEILHMDRRFQYEFALKKLKKEQCGDNVMMLLDEEENPNLLEQDQLFRNCKQQVKKYEQIFNELGQENQSVHKRNGELEKELEQFKRKVCIEAMTHNLERCHEEMEELGGEKALLQNNVACQKRLEEHQVVQQELEHNLSPDYSYIEQLNKALEEELEEAQEKLCIFQRVMENETVHKKNAQLQLEVLEQVHHEVIQEKESQHEALEQKVQELNEEQHKVKVLEEELQEAQEKLCTFQRVMENETVHAKKCQLKVNVSFAQIHQGETWEALEHEVQEQNKKQQKVKVIQCHSDAIVSHMIEIERSVFDGEQIKAGKQEELLQTHKIDVEITTKENVKIQIELQSLKSPKPKRWTSRFFRWFRKG